MKETHKKQTKNKQKTNKKTNKKQQQKQTSMTSSFSQTDASLPIAQCSYMRNTKTLCECMQRNLKISTAVTNNDS